MPSIPRQHTLLPIALALFAVLSAAPVHADNSIAANFTRVSAGESVLAPFTTAASSTLGAYAGLVEIRVSGTGNSAASAVNDAFYFDGGSASGSWAYQFNIGWAAAPLLPAVTDRNAVNVITFIENVGPVSAGTRPAYAADHVYQFVVNVPAVAGALQFGVADGNYADNGGAFTVQVWQLQAGAVPEPGVPFLFAAGLGVLALLVRRNASA